MPYDEELAERLRETLDGRDGITEKRMFGGLAFLLHGNMAVCAGSGGQLMVRIDPLRADTLLAQDGVERMVMRGRPMKGWLLVDRAVLDDDSLPGWVEEGLSFVESLPVE
ncbi:TfoX/Sxy family transcriptional regulator of competence genes [Actinomycetospora succinea]|uniref:TfoX/Sxy family transcriptional regulator of competence genes n=1 Tax=Actinomycetospora succinea TaxID=663603 RepID=A0A4R6VJ33_9PSEU|nr:TfoX/Sxy family protein [Actinomycetospora succinea]TDQ58509.1 TfoX/Sxy family transcriptional regulator of competence genes [Actinomycetospora succinea]